MKFYFGNHWKCFSKRGGHAILLGFQWHAMSDYEFRKQFSFDICILGFEFGLMEKP